VLGPPQKTTRQYAFPGPLQFTALGAGGGIDLDKLALDGIPEQADERFPNPVGRVAQASTMLHFVQQLDDIDPPNLSDEAIAKRGIDMVAEAAGADRDVVGILRGVISGQLMVSDQAARSIG
jgi:hypothetical protein